MIDRGLPAAVNLVGPARELVPEPLVAMAAAGFELQLHGWRWIDHQRRSAAEERDRMRRSIEQVRRLTGAPPLGYYAGMPSMDTRRLAVEMGVLHDSDRYEDGFPFRSSEFSNPILVVPHLPATIDSRLARLTGRPGRIGALSRIPDHIRARERVWVCRRVNMARLRVMRFPPEG